MKFVNVLPDQIALSSRRINYSIKFKIIESKKNLIRSLTLVSLLSRVDENSWGRTELRDKEAFHFRNSSKILSEDKNFTFHRIQVGTYLTVTSFFFDKFFFSQVYNGWLTFSFVPPESDANNKLRTTFSLY